MFVSQQSDCLIVKNSYVRDEVLFKLSWELRGSLVAVVGIIIIS